MKVTIKNIPTYILRSQLEMIKIILNDYNSTCKNASIAAVAGTEIINELNERGIKISNKNVLFYESYWQGENIKNETNNKNPLVGVDEYYNILRKHPNIHIDRRRQDIKNQVDVILNSQNESQKTQPTPKNAKFQLRIGWTGFFKDVDKVLKFFQELGFNEPESQTYEYAEGQEQHLLLYIFEGSTEGFNMLKRSVDAMLNIFCGENFEIGISGKKI